ncbi:MAG: type I-MYXAN CRISPR-associated protein Cas6/Cmx6 [Myxococcota bacterium]
MPNEVIPSTLVLSGKSLVLEGRQLTVGVPTIHVLRPATTLVSRFTTIKGFEQEEEFRAALSRQLESLDINSESMSIDVLRRRVMRIASKSVIGFGVRLHGLDQASSIRIQERGLGGRRHMGGGVFSPVTSSGQ